MAVEAEMTGSRTNFSRLKSSNEEIEHNRLLLARPLLDSIC